MPRTQVWAALNDPEVLRSCIPGCTSLEKTSDTSFTARVTSKIGPVSAAFKGAVELSDIEPEQAYTISGSGQGGVAGFAKGGARVTLTDDGDAATVLSYKATAEIGGKLASVGSRMLEGVARKTADQFFDAFVAQLAGEPAEEDSAGSDSMAALTAANTKAAPQTLRIEVGDIRVVHQMPWLAGVAAAGWVVALMAFAWRAH